MSPKKFAEKQKVHIDTVYNWLSKGYIQGAYKKKNKWIIPENAKRPYLQTGKCIKSGILKSILKAYYNGKIPIPSKYKLSDEEFQAIHQYLLSAGLIYLQSFNNTDYYIVTEKGIDSLKLNSHKFKDLAISLVTQVAGTTFSQLILKIIN